MLEWAGQGGGGAMIHGRMVLKGRCGTEGHDLVCIVGMD